MPRSVPELGTNRRASLRALRADTGVLGAWLGGSLGRGQADAWSDLELHVGVEDTVVEALLDDASCTSAPDEECCYNRRRSVFHPGRRTPPVGPVRGPFQCRLKYRTMRRLADWKTVFEQSSVPEGRDELVSG